MLSVSIAAETDRIIRGIRDATNLNVPLHAAVLNAQRSTVLYGEGRTRLPSMPTLRRFHDPCSVTVVRRSTLAVVLEEVASTEGIMGWHVGCLNFASATRPGGRYRSSVGSQEEQLARSSALVSCLETQMDGFYKANRDFESKYALDLGIVSPFVPFLRGEPGALLDRVSLCTVISVPAPVKGCIAKKDRDDLIPCLVRRIGMILQLAAFHRIDALVLGAWGCGDPGNSPADVALAFARPSCTGATGTGSGRWCSRCPTGPPPRRRSRRFSAPLLQRGNSGIVERGDRCPGAAMRKHGRFYRY
jgi:uncharacterized protein (TIGR02452 family)